MKAMRLKIIFVVIVVTVFSVLTFLPDHSEKTPSRPTPRPQVIQKPVANNPKVSPPAPWPGSGAEVISPPLQSNTNTTEIEHQSPPYKNSATVREKLTSAGDIAYMGETYPLREYKTQFIPNDPNASQWWTAAAKLEQAWDTPRGSGSTILAIIDTGFGLEHQEFQNRWFTSAGETGASVIQAPSQLNCTDRGLPVSKSCNLIDDDSDGIVDNETGPTSQQNPSRLNCAGMGRATTRDCNRIDDDGNGLVDDWRGWDFINFDHSPQAGEINPSGDGVHHGTYVTGAAAATGNNGVGIAGTDWGTKILPIQALDDDAYGHTVSVARSIRYAAEQGADVISLSLGTYYDDYIVREAVQEAIAAGSVVVAASGNDGCDCILYPANYPEVIAVGALNSSGQRASFSSYGSNLDILAPGTNFYTTDWHNSNRLSAYAGGISGTSLATPVVSGLLTRALSQQPNASPLQLIAALTENTNRGLLPENVARQNNAGFGSLDALKVTSRMANSFRPSQINALSPISLGNVLTPASPNELVRNAPVYDCRPQAYGTTTLFELKKASSWFFSASVAESDSAVKAGYTSTIFTQACLLQPHDVPVNVRTMNIFREFYNLNPKTTP